MVMNCLINMIQQIQNLAIHSLNSTNNCQKLIVRSVFVQIKSEECSKAQPLVSLDWNKPKENVHYVDTEKVIQSWVRQEAVIVLWDGKLPAAYLT